MMYTLRNMLAALKAEYFILSGQVKKRQKLIHKNGYILSIYFHNPSSKNFKSCIKWLVRNNYSFLSMDEIISIINNANQIPSNKVLITVDDGWRDNYSNIAAIANEYKVPVTIFCTTEPIINGDRFWWSYISSALKYGIKTKDVQYLKTIPNKERLKYIDKIKHKVLPKREAMTMEELQEIAESPYVTIGSHTVTHPILNNCTDAEAKFEINESKNILETYLSKNIKYFSYPNGDFSNREIEYVKNAGYEISFGVEPKYLDIHSVKNRYNLPRFEILDNASFAENICRITGLWFN